MPIKLSITLSVREILDVGFPEIAFVYLLQRLRNLGGSQQCHQLKKYSI